MPTNINKAINIKVACISAVEPIHIDLALLCLERDDLHLAQAKIERVNNWANTKSDYQVQIYPTGLHLLETPNKETVQLPIENCTTCTIRDAIVAYVKQWRKNIYIDTSKNPNLLIALPTTVELAHLCPGLQANLETINVELTGVTHLVELESFPTKLLEHTEIGTNGLLPGINDSRCAGEVHLNNVAYADMTLALGNNNAGIELLEHLRPHDCLLACGLDKPVLDQILSLTHDSEKAIERTHPATTQAWGGPIEHGTWTVDLYSEKPFHPTRLREIAKDIAQAGCIVRGCFWLPSRPNQVCTWESVGTVASIGDAGDWEEVPFTYETFNNSSPRCHFVVTGIGDEFCKQQIINTFESILLTTEEMHNVLDWVGVNDDGLNDWFTA